ncbi:MAG: TetR/AcrR family transcriptional regulator [Clostridiales bacterium]|nr:TetR/AcrR family transcriptional regulator [Clostridiales bacterium]
MPPKCKFTKNEIIQAALYITRTTGIDSITARALGAQLCASSKPIFSIFKNMEEVQQEVIKAAKKEYNQYIKKGLSQTPAFKGVGTQYIIFAQKEPKLFQLLFMTEQLEKKDSLGMLPLLDDNYNKIVSSIQTDYGLNEPDAKKLYRHLWIYTHGIASLLATNVCNFADSEISNMLTEVFKSLLKQIKEQQAQ